MGSQINLSELRPLAGTTKTRAVVGAILAAGVAAAALASVCAARTDQAVSAPGEVVAPASKGERSGSLAVYPLVY
jgi:tRNA U38,U39,U40 pseudouridine synthase TruA